jgi:hypothetical protein
MASPLGHDFIRTQSRYGASSFCVTADFAAPPALFLTHTLKGDLEIVRNLLAEITGRA